MSISPEKSPLSGTSDATVHVIEDEARKMLSKAVEGAKKLVREHRDSLTRLVDALLTRETVEREELGRILGSNGAATARAPEPSEPPSLEARQ